MKSSLLGLGLAAICASTAVAQLPSVLFEQSQTPRQPLVVSPSALATPPVQMVPSTQKHTENTQGLTFTNMYQTDFFPNWEIANENSVFVYEPISKTTILVRGNRVFANNQLTGGQLRFYTTTDNGASWNEVEAYNQPGKFLPFPNFAVVNTKGANAKFEDLNWALFCGLYEQSSSWARNGQVGLFMPSSGLFEFPMPAPDNAPSDMGWGIFGDMVGVSTDNPAVYHTQRLDKPINNGPTQYGVLGTWGYDFNAEDFTTNSVPSAWNIDQFQTPDPPNLGSTLNTSPLVGADADGKLYAAGNFVFTSNPSERVPSVSSSENQGATWSDFNKMPYSLITSYQTSRGWSNIRNYGVYEMDAFVVTGSDEYSYILRLGTVEENRWASIDIVEARYAGGTWSLNKVADINGFPLQFIRQDSISDAEGQYAWIPAYSANPLGHEVQVAKTADGSSILVKWIDDNPEYIDSGFTQRVAFQSNGQWAQDELTAITATDVFVSYRSVNGGTWSTPRNLTNDRVYDHGTRIPPVIESLTSVPLLTLKTIEKSQYNQSYPFLPAINQVQNMVLDASVDYRTPNTVRTTFFNATVVSVDEEPSYSFHINSITPNPTSANAELAFTMNQPGMVSINVFAPTGEKVASIFNGSLEAGLHGLNIPTNNLSVGAYYVTISIGGEQSTQQLVVVR